MVQILNKEKAKFRITIRDLETKKSKTISLMNGGSITLKDIVKKIKEIFTP